MKKLSLILLLGLVLSSAAPPASAAVAPGCSADRPTKFAGTIKGYPDNRAVNTHIGITLRSTTGQHIMLDDSTTPVATYAYIFKLNPTLPPYGSSTEGVFNWSICVPASAVQGGAEAYPKQPVAPGDVDAVTDLSRYGRTAYYRMPITPGSTTNMQLRLPVTWQAAQGNTGGIHGYLSYQGRPIPPDKITRVRAFPKSSGSDCGIEGYSAAADQLVTGASGKTYFRVDYLAAGQCGAIYQYYSLQIDCMDVCGATKKEVRKVIGVRKGYRSAGSISFG